MELIVIITVIIGLRLLHLHSKHNRENAIIMSLYKGEKMTTLTANGKEQNFVGSCTVWRELPTYERCSTSQEEMLCRLWSAHKHEG